MVKFILGIVAGVIIVCGGVLVYFTSGMAPAATSDPPMPFEKRIAQAALSARIRKEMPATVPIQADETAFLAGAHTYRENCAMCHGLPNQPVPVIAKGMFPAPPQLLPPHKGVSDDPPGETFWKVKNGIRLTGMPGFSASLTDQQAWEVSLLLAHADKLPADVQQSLVASPAAGNPPK